MSHLSRDEVAGGLDDGTPEERSENATAQMRRSGDGRDRISLRED